MIGILSDSHDNLNAIRDAVRLIRAAGCDLLIHAGDFVAPFAAKELEDAGCPVRAVFGNCDGEKTGLRKALQPFGSIREAPLVLEHGGRKILVAHLDVSVAQYIANRGYDVVVYGHTHRAEVRRSGGTVIINPGETGGWVTKKRTIALYDPAAHEAEIIPL
ncbi:MAG: metallophosphoesterase [Candidatus Aminicenantes bacterium]|nr:metallophosphoesterase [Candidatus Aminicenantes bacterium]